MSEIIAIAGKGGTGKTTLAALIVRVLREENRGSILAIDADPNSNFGELLAVRDISTVVEIVDNISRNPSQIPAGITKDRFINMKLQESLNEEEGFDLLTMGRPEGPGCYCFANNLLRGLIKKLVGNFSYVVIDNEAGMEHLSRRLIRSIDRLFVVSDASITGVRSANKISNLVDELKINVRERALILNKAKTDVSVLKDEIERMGMGLRMILPFSEELEDAAIEGRSIFELSERNPLLEAVKRVLYGGIKGKLDTKN